MDTVVRVENLGKEYRLGVIGNGSLYKDIQSWAARLFRKEDPWTEIGGESKVGRKDRFWALRDVSFEVKKGDRLGIVGRNGAGKSTLLKVLSQITAPTTGSVKIKGHIASLLEVGTGFHPELTGRENIYLNGAILGMKRTEIDRKFDEIVAFSEIESEFVDTPVKRYSSGMFVRLAFAVAAHLDSEILIADEVLAVGDARFQQKCLGLMKDVSENQGRTVLFVSHMMFALKQLCTKGILLEHGVLLETGPMDDIAVRYEKMIAEP
jgi:lipopolysaccharide transport system ATP-binding protein